MFGLDYDWVDGLKIPDEKEFYEQPVESDYK